MSQADSARAFQQPEVDSGTNPRKDDEPTVDTTEVLSLLSDEYAREMLNILVEDSLSARALSERLDMSRATIYRRLDRLESAGVIESSMIVDPEGHHRKRFSVVLDRMQLLFEPDGISLEVGE
jgi:DNA-binding transcriptional ArsR family regulator